MVDLMQVQWVRRGHRARGDEAADFWNTAELQEKLDFANTWPAAPREHFEKFSSIGTRRLLALLHEIAGLRTAIFVDGMPPNHSMLPDKAIWHDTLDVVKHHPFHCGGWLGLLTVEAVAHHKAAIVNRPDPNGPYSYITWPPAASRNLLGILTWLMQSIHMEPSNAFIGNQWTANTQMLQFLRGQKATGGFESMSRTLRGLAYENADKQLLHFYLTHLRGHGPTEVGTDHHMFKMVENVRDADAQAIPNELERTIDTVMHGFPSAWGRGAVGDWSGEVSDHVMVWLKGMGNHPVGLQWLSEMLARRIAEWERADVRDWIGGTRTTQRQVSRTITDNFQVVITEMTSIITRVGAAYRTATTEEWTSALETSLTQMSGWSDTTTQGSELLKIDGEETSNATTVGGESGGLAKFLIGKAKGEFTHTAKEIMSKQFRTHLEHERATSGSTTGSRSRTTSAGLQRMRETSYNITREVQNTMSTALTFGTQLARSVQDTVNQDGDLGRQVGSVQRGLTQGKAMVDRARGP